MKCISSANLAITLLSLAGLAVPVLADSSSTAATGSGGMGQQQPALPDPGASTSAASDPKAAPAGQEYTQAQINEMVNNPLGELFRWLITEPRPNILARHSVVAVIALTETRRHGEEEQ